MREVTYRTKPTSTEDGKLVFTYNNAVVRKYSWGLDLSGQSGDASPSGIHGAGGIGGLLAAVETSGTHAGSYWYLYDANGNVGQVLNVTDPQSITPAAHYEYDPYGNTVAKSGTYADDNPFRFSTKWRDDETDLYYYGYRYYSPGLGRWISRDPIESSVDPNTHGFVLNAPTLYLDADGGSTIGIPNAPGGGFPPSLPKWDDLPASPSCTITLVPSGVALGQRHYGLSIATPSGTWTIDAGPQTNPEGRCKCDVLGFGTPSGSPFNQIPTDSSPCACVLREAMKWKTTTCYRAVLCPNSNTAVNKVLKACGLHIARPSGAWCWHQDRMIHGG